MKIIFVEDCGFGGYALLAYNICNALKRHGYDVCLVTNEEYEYKSFPVDYDNQILFKSLRKKPDNKLLWLFNRIDLYIANARRLLKFLKGKENYVLHLFSSNYFLNGLVCLLARKDIKIIANVHDVKPHYSKGSLYMRLQGFLENVVRKRADKLVVFTDQGKKELQDAIVQKDKVVKVEHGMVMFPYGDDTAQGNKHKNKLNLLCFGSIRPNKGYEKLIEAINMIPQAKRNQVKLSIVGKAEEKSYLELLDSMIGKYRLNGSIELLDRYVDISEVALYFEDKDIVVLPYTNFHSQSGVAYLAHSFGLPVLASHIGGLGEHISRTGAGVSVPPADAKALSSRIIELLENRSLLDKYRENVKKFTEEAEVEWKLIANSYGRCYNAS